MSKKKAAAEAETEVIATGDGIRVSEHPAAARSIPRIRAWTGLAGFVLAAWFAQKAHVPFEQTVVRAILGGAVASLAAWGAALVIWRQLIFAELAAARRAAALEQREAAERLASHSEAQSARA